MAIMPFPSIGILAIKGNLPSQVVVTILGAEADMLEIKMGNISGLGEVNWSCDQGKG